MKTEFLSRATMYGVEFTAAEAKDLRGLFQGSDRITLPSVKIRREPILQKAISAGVVVITPTTPVKDVGSVQLTVAGKAFLARI